MATLPTTDAAKHLKHCTVTVECDVRKITSLRVWLAFKIVKLAGIIGGFGIRALTTDEE